MVHPKDGDFSEIHLNTVLYWKTNVPGCVHAKQIELVKDALGAALPASPVLSFSILNGAVNAATGVNDAVLKVDNRVPLTTKIYLKGTATSHSVIVAAGLIVCGAESIGLNSTTTDVYNLTLKQP